MTCPRIGPVALLSFWTKSSRLTPFSAGKPLRIGLSKRLGIGELTDDCPLLARHFEALSPDVSQSIQDPIPCSQVAIDRSLIATALRDIPDVADVALQDRADGNVNAYISVGTRSTLLSSDVSRLLSSLLPGYSIPEHIHLLPGPLVKDGTEFDFVEMEKLATRSTEVQMTKRQILVRDIVAELLNIDPEHIHTGSDFFLLGGNSLLLGKLSHHVRRQSGINIGITELFTESTIHGIASLIQEREAPGADSENSLDNQIGKSSSTCNSSITAFSLDYDYDQDPEFSQTRRERTQDHPLCLVVQAIPFLFFYPLKTALTCE